MSWTMGEYDARHDAREDDQTFKSPWWLVLAAVLWAAVWLWAVPPAWDQMMQPYARPVVDAPANAAIGDEAPQ